ncbi:Protein argonaute 18 [Zea mays]|uniref:Uncharacterized protein n=1 Tax=Zea mays TaxID=4577 RepID=C0PDS4_MAIZE|nr:Protein argonaute 18 [Zea mays]ACN33340.1 unknown [Zea mays]|eukprot:XP_008672596.1 uncharacterized protein LOC100279313 isoform X1 [Zea mays]
MGRHPPVDEAMDFNGNGRDEANPSGSEAGNHNEHRGDDPSRVGQSLPADIRQNGQPTLGEEITAPLWEEFEALGIHVRRSEPVFPPRPGYGAAGTPYVVRANLFLGRLVDEALHQYNVTISPEPTPKAAYREIMTKLLSENQHTDFDGRFSVYDDGDSLFTAGALPFDTKEFEVPLSAGGDEKMDRKYKVMINHAATISLLQLRMLLAGYPTDIPAQALVVLDTVLRDVFNERNDMECVVIDKKDRTLGVDAWKGLYLSIRPTQNCLSLIADVSSSVFVQPLLLIEFVQKILKIDAVDRNLTKPEYDKLLKALRGVRIQVTHRDNRRRVWSKKKDNRRQLSTYRVAGLSVNPTNDLSFESKVGVTTTVIDYFREIYGLELKYKYLPCVNAGSEQDPIYFPIEVCKIAPKQCYQKKLEGSQFSTPRKSAWIHPEAEQSCPQIVEQRQYKQTKRANEFDLEFDGNLTTVAARVLLPPNLKYDDSVSQKTWFPLDGYWNMKDKKVINGAKIRNWACLNFCEDLSKEDIKKFCFKLAEMSRITGLDFADLKLPIFTARPDRVEDGIRRCYQEAKNKLRDQKIDLLLAILPDKKDSLYGNIKRICETDIGLVSQCCRRSRVLVNNNQILANIAIKINAKVGGRISVFDDVQKSLPVVSNKPTIIFGAHVSHPSVVDGSTGPSIASVVASQDWHEVSKYNGVVRAQGHTEEIGGLEDIVKELLHAFANESKEKLQQLIFYRDGISEGQFNRILEKEIPAIEKAWNALYDNEKPQITFVVVQKRHKLRLFPVDDNYKIRSAKKKIVEPGTVVDSEICHPAEFDFFLCSQSGGIKGPRRPVRYLVLRDDNNFTADELQALTNNLCYTYSGGNRSLSVAPPAYYAQKLAHRARVYLAKGSDNNAAAANGGRKQIPEIKNELKGSMFYC